MSTVTVQLELPEELARQLDPSGAEVAARALEAIVVQLFHQGRISSGRAARVLGISRRDFRALLRSWDVPYFDLTAEELRAELEASRQAEVPQPS
jgi:predicted HTH domain antitoxin